MKKITKTFFVKLPMTRKTPYDKENKLFKILRQRLLLGLPKISISLCQSEIHFDADVKWKLIVYFIF